MEDANAHIHHTILSHLDKKRSYLRLLFINYSSAFNIILPSRLFSKLKDPLWEVKDHTQLCSYFWLQQHYCWWHSCHQKQWIGQSEVRRQPDLLMSRQQPLLNVSKASSHWSEWTASSTLVSTSLRAGLEAASWLEAGEDGEADTVSPFRRLREV